MIKYWEGLILHGDDIEDPSHYSIEDAKLKAEHDRKLKAAKAKKQKVSTANVCNNIIVYSIIITTIWQP